MKRTLFLFILILIQFTCKAQKKGERPFITTWKIDHQNITIEIPTFYLYKYNYDIDWGDGTVTHNTEYHKHKYTKPGKYQIKITGDFPAIHFESTPGMCLYLSSIDQWGDIQWLSMAGAFKGCRILKIKAKDAPSLKKVKVMSKMFEKSGIESPQLNHWNVSGVKSMSKMFKSAKLFNGKIDKWDVSNVSSMSYMFFQAEMFNRDISQWDVSGVGYMASMFGFAKVFNQDLSKWNVEYVNNCKGFEVSSFRNRDYLPNFKKCEY